MVFESTNRPPRNRHSENIFVVHAFLIRTLNLYGVYNICWALNFVVLNTKMRHPSSQRGVTRCENKTAAVNISSAEEKEEKRKRRRRRRRRRRTDETRDVTLKM